MTSQLKTGNSSHIIFITLFSNRCTAALLPFYTSLRRQIYVHIEHRWGCSRNLLLESLYKITAWYWLPGCWMLFANLLTSYYCFLLSLLPSNDLSLYPTHFNALTATPLSSVRNNLSMGLFHFVKWPCPG